MRIRIACDETVCILLMSSEREGILQQLKRAAGAIAIGFLGTVAAFAEATTEDTLDINAAGAFANLADGKTNAQRQAWFDSAKGKRVRWKLKVGDVEKGWYAYTVTAKVGANQVHCELPLDDTNAYVLQINKGQSITCDGVIASYVKLFGTLIVVTATALDR
jgi:hypothetical protein